MMGDFLDGRGLDKADYTRTFKSPRVKRRAQRAEADQRQFAVTGTPTLIVAGKYRVDMRNGQRRALVVAGQLIEQERAAEAPGAES